MRNELLQQRRKIMGEVEALKVIEDRISQLEKVRHGNNAVDDSMRRARLDVEQKGIYSAVWKWVPPDYYTWPLTQRAETLGARSLEMLCKSLVMENKMSDGKDPSTNPRFVLVVVQYASSLDTKKLASAIRALRPVKERLDYNQFDFRVASMEDNDRLTGYSHNSVTPFGLMEKNLPVILSSSVVPQQFFFMGGGHVHLKLGMAVSEFVSAAQALVADISNPRSGYVDKNDDFS